MHKKVIIFGTRPEFIKLLPVFWEIIKQDKRNEYVYIYTGQQANLISELFNYFGFIPDIDISFKEHNNSLSLSFAYILNELQKNIDFIRLNYQIKMLIAQGDTTSCAAAAMCSFFNNIPFAHVEAGLRTNNLQHPFPEEYFRKVVSISSTIHFVPTDSARNNLLAEGVDDSRIFLTGNTVVDIIEKFKYQPDLFHENCRDKHLLFLNNNVLITCHRRENQGQNFNELIKAIKTLANENKEFNFIWISHSSPFVKEKLRSDVFSEEKNIFIVPPLNNFELYEFYSKIRLIITDSGGIQEEAPSFNIPVIVIRQFTERYESVKMGYSELVLDIENDLIPVFYKLINNPISEMKNPYGDGCAAEKIVNVLNLV